ncbi:hypothetical protein AAC387_Pa01g2189 [Persea americana]
MFYSPGLLSRKGPLGVIWIASHCCRKLRKVQVVEADVSSSVDKIMLAEVPIAFRVLGHLLIGVVRIYAKKVEYLYHDCNEALIRIKDLFASGKISLSKGVRHTPYFSVTLPQKFELDAFDLEDVEDVQGSDVRPNRQITLQDEWADEANQYSFMDKFHNEETGSHPDFYSPSLTLVEDFPHAMDFCLETSDSHVISGFRDSIEKLRGDLLPPDDGLDLELYCGEVESFDLNQYCGEMGPCVGQIMSEQMTFSDSEKSLVLAEGFPLDTSPAKSCDNSSVPKISVSTTTDVMIIPTPTKEERSRLSRKRKHFLDEAVVLSNEVLRQRIHDASGLIHVRRKAPCTSLDAWKADKVFNLCQNFMDPLIPCISSELKVLFTKDYLNSSELNESKVRSTGSSINSKPNKLRFETDSESGCEELSVIETPGLWLNLMDEENSSHEEDHQKHERWSNRTRAVAQFLHRTFHNQEEIFSLTCQLEGVKRKTCARLFYETLVLKTEGYIDVTQDSPYGEILLMETLRMKAMF